MPHDIFISYSSHDKAIADATCAALEAQRIRCWIAPRDVLAGSEYADSIVKAIESCRITLLIFSAAANVSPHIRREVERAVSKGKIIIPLRIEDVTPSGAMEYCLGNTHWLDAMTPPLESHLATLTASVSALLGENGPTEQASQMTGKPFVAINIPEDAKARLTVLNVFMDEQFKKWRSADEGSRLQIEEEARTTLAELRNALKMSKPVFEFYMKICFEEGRILHQMEFIEKHRLVEFVKRHRRFGNDVGRWLMNNVAGIDSSND